MKSVRSNSISLKYQRFPILGFKDIEIRKFGFSARLNSFMGSGIQTQSDQGRYCRRAPISKENR